MPKAGIVKENKAFSVQIKEFNDAEGRIKGYLSTFDNVDEGKDRVRPGAFKRTLANKYAYKQKNNKRYVMPFLWQHDTNEPVGGFLELKEDQIGLWFDLEIDLDIQRGRECYSGYKKGYIYQTSMGYDCLQSEYVKVDGEMVRDLLEVRLWEGSAVTFPMNELAVVTSVKSKNMETKTVCGDTSLPIGPRKDTWDGDAAKKQIFNYAQNGDSFDASKLKKCFLQQDGDPQQKGSWHYPFVEIVSGSPQINVAGVIACANALNGARDADAGEDTAGMRKKVATIYGRINAKYPNDDALEPPWEDSGKARNRRMQQKTLMEHYNEEMAQDLLEDWQDVYVCALSKAIFDAFTIGDQPASDISDALDNFKELVISKFVAQAVECGLSQYIADSGYSYNPASTTLQNGSDSGYGYYGYMSSNRSRSQKVGRTISASNQANIDDHVANMHNMANTMLSDMKAHAKAMHGALDDFAKSMAGKPEPDDDQDTQDDESKAVSSALRELKLLRTR